MVRSFRNLGIIYSVFFFTIASILLLSIEARLSSGVKLVGGWQPSKVDSSKKAIFLHTLSSEAFYNHDIGTRICTINFVSLQQQIVSGVNYLFTVDGCQLSELSLPSDFDGYCNSITSIHLTNNGCLLNPTLYDVKLYVQSWTNTYEILSIEVSKPSTMHLYSTKTYAEDELIEKWIHQNGLNDYGDPKDTVYPYSSPLYDAKGMTIMSKVEYILAKHPEKPWVVPEKISEEDEIKLAEDWIKKNGLNQYGDEPGTMYIGGNPLFDESTGEMTSMLDYIAKNHPNRPWLVNAKTASYSSFQSIDNSTNYSLLKKMFYVFLVISCGSFALYLVHKHFVKYERNSGYEKLYRR